MIFNQKWNEDKKNINDLERSSLLGQTIIGSRYNSLA